MSNIAPLCNSKSSKAKNLCNTPERNEPENISDCGDSVINLERFDKDILKAFSFKQMGKAHKTLLASHQQLVLSNGPNSFHTKQTFSSIRQYEQFANRLNEKGKNFSAVVKAGFVLEKPVELNSSFSSDKKLDSSNNSSQKNHKEKEIELWIDYDRSFSMPPPLTTSHHSLLNHDALDQFRHIQTLENARSFVEEFGSHFINCKYNLGGFYAEDSNILRNENTRQQNEDASKSGSVSAGVNLMLIGTEGKYSNKQSNSDKTNTSFNESETSCKGIRSIFHAKSRQDFLEKLFSSIYNSKILDEIFEINLTKILDITEQRSELNGQVQFCFRFKENKTLNKSQLEANFRKAFTPIWELVKPDQRTWLQYNLVKIVCLFCEESLFFNMEFKSLLDVNETVIVDSYLEALEEYFFRIVKNTKFSFDERPQEHNEWQKRIESIFMKELDNQVHFTNLKICADNQISYLNENYRLVHFSRDNKNKFLYLLFYSLELLNAYPDEWSEKLKCLKEKGDEDRSHNKCAIVDYDQFPESFRDKSFFNTICLKQYFNATNEFKDFETSCKSAQNEPQRKMSIQQ